MFISSALIKIKFLLFYCIFGGNLYFIIMKNILLIPLVILLNSIQSCQYNDEQKILELKKAIAKENRLAEEAKLEKAKIMKENRLAEKALVEKAKINEQPRIENSIRIEEKDNYIKNTSTSKLIGHQSFDDYMSSKNKPVSKATVQDFSNFMTNGIEKLQNNKPYIRPHAYDASSQGANKARYKAYGQETYDRVGFNPEINNELMYNSKTNKYR